MDACSDGTELCSEDGDAELANPARFTTTNSSPGVSTGTPTIYDFCASNQKAWRTGKDLDELCSRMIEELWTQNGVMTNGMTKAALNDKWKSIIGSELAPRRVAKVAARLRTAHEQPVSDMEWARRLAVDLEIKQVWHAREPLRNAEVRSRTLAQFGNSARRRPFAG
jgi:hypothetical protein